MAQKRMFDRAIIDTDRFMDLGMSAKAMYFLLGMEADDEGFVSFKKVLRIHGGNEDDVKLLIAKSFLLAFPTGVVVITDWNKNNYIDKNRMKPTEYLHERKMLGLTQDGKYEFNNGLTSIVESSIESVSKETHLIELTNERTDSDGEAIQPKRKVTSKREDHPNFRVREYFRQQHQREFKCDPEIWASAAAMGRVKYALEHLTEKECMEKIDDWFLNAQVDNDVLGNIMRCFSNVEVAKFKSV